MAGAHIGQAGTAPALGPATWKNQSMKLHKAIEEVLSDAPGRRATSTEIAIAVNRRGLYVRPSDGAPVEASRLPRVSVGALTTTFSMSMAAW